MTETQAAPIHGDRLLYSVSEAAGMLGLGTTKIWELIARGDLKGVKIDGARRISRKAIERYIASLEGGGDVPAAG